ncbi:major facilitator superfamily domain-containing protein [Aspergillus pseudocaelatus]|uniref:Major facilitator superfamily domain-containing protein n=1 Tax=Aspergillus pseudocaelatus TaxID=1825620 RepID=A0ABQ6WLN4_9EURO|nr:major facilitator superfamily domain-containing protein [Aspergillus pseudocaelatus]
MQTRHKSLGMWHRIWLFFLLGTSNSRKIVGNIDHHPYVVSWPANDALNGRNYGTMRKISIIALSGLSTLSVAFASSAYSGDLSSICQYFEVSDEAATLGLSLYVLGFAIGPLLRAPMSEAFGRIIVFLVTFSLFTIFNIAAAISANFASVVIFRALAGMFGSAPLTNSGGVVADLYSAETRGLAAVFYSCATFLGLWVEGLLAIYSGIMLILGVLCIPETFSNVLLRRRAVMLSMKTGKLYVTSVDHRNPPGSLAERFQVSTTRPLHLLSKEPIVVVLALYMSFLYGTTYLLLAALPIVFQRVRGWSPGMGGLAFVPIAIGMLFATAFMVFINRQYTRKFRASETGQLPPEARLPSGKVGAALIPIGLFLFAWANDPSIHWAVCMVGTAFFGFGNICVTLALVNYLVDSYFSLILAISFKHSFTSIPSSEYPLLPTRDFEYRLQTVLNG